MTCQALMGVVRGVEIRCNLPKDHAGACRSLLRVPQEQSYEPPKLTPLGRVQDLLGGNTGSTPEGKSGMVGWTP